MWSIRWILLLETLTMSTAAARRTLGMTLSSTSSFGSGGHQSSFVSVSQRRRISGGTSCGYFSKSRPRRKENGSDRSTSALFSTIDRSKTDEVVIKTPSAEGLLPQQPPLKVNLHTIEQKELEMLLKEWGHETYRGKQILSWIRQKGVTNFNDMNNIPQRLKQDLSNYATIGTLECVSEQISQKDGTIKRAYALKDGQLIESVLMPYDDGRYTACVSSQAGCAMGCVFCATGQMGFARQLTSDEIFEQVALFDSLLKQRGDKQRVSNVVMMGMGEPLANYRNVMTAIRRMNTDLGIGARKITVSTVGVVPSIRKLYQTDDDLQVRLAISLHCATDEERSNLLPANTRYGGLHELLSTAHEYCTQTKRRITFEWALIHEQNDTPEVARTLGDLLMREHQFRSHQIHINVIPLNPTSKFVEGKPSQRTRVNEFLRVLTDEYGISATPRVRRGIDIDAGCGQLKSKVEKQKRNKKINNDDDDSDCSTSSTTSDSPSQALTNNDNSANVYYNFSHDEDNNNVPTSTAASPPLSSTSSSAFVVDKNAINLDGHLVMEGDDNDDEAWFDEDDFIDEVWDTEEDRYEISRLMSLVQNTASATENVSITGSASENIVVEQTALKPVTATNIKPASTKTTTSIVNEDMIRDAKKRRKKLLRNLKQIEKLKLLKHPLNDEQLLKVSKEEEWKHELESVEHNLQ